MALSYNQPHSIPWDVKLGVHWLGLVKKQSIVSLYICNFNIQNLLLEKCLQSQTIYDYDSIREEPLHNVCSQIQQKKEHTTVLFCPNGYRPWIVTLKEHNICSDNTMDFCSFHAVTLTSSVKFVWNSSWSEFISNTELYLYLSQSTSI